MADVKIAQLLEATTVSDTDLFVVEDSADTKKITKPNLQNTLLGNRTYTEQNVVTNGESLTNSINELDKAYIPYEEGTWTPQLTFNDNSVGISYLFQVGSYVKIGKLAVVSFTIVITKKGSSTGSAKISNLPFAAGTTSNLFSGSFAQTLFMSSNALIYLQNKMGSGVLELKKHGTDGSVTDTDFTNSSQIRGTYTYITQ